MPESDVRPGMRVKVTQCVQYRGADVETEVIGTVLSAEPQPTGAWFAHAKDHRYWLIRIELQKDDGEITRLIMDRNTRITVMDG